MLWIIMGVFIPGSPPQALRAFVMPVLQMGWNRRPAAPYTFRRRKDRVACRIALGRSRHVQDSLRQDDLRLRLAKTGGTVFRPESIDIRLDSGLSLPASAVNALRREALDSLSVLRTAPPERQERPAPPPPEGESPCTPPQLTLSLSGGEQQMLAIGRALMNAPQVMLADEPTGSLDSKNGHEIIKLLKQSNRMYGQTLLIVTHDENIALQADRIIGISDGKVVRDERVVRS